METALKFAVSDIKEQEGLTFSGPVPVEELNAEGLFGQAKLQAPCTANLEFSVGGSSILMEGHVEGQWLFPCNRCLAEHSVAFKVALEETYPTTLETIDAGEDVRQLLALNLPRRSLCREDCKGLCDRCGANLNEGLCRCPQNERGREPDLPVRSEVKS